MLSRVADSIYWMSRYVERAENVARFVGVMQSLSLGGIDAQWSTLVYASGDEEAFEKERSEYSREQVLRFALFDDNNPNSVISCVRNARENARSIRGELSTAMWEAVNRFYLRVSDAAKDPQAVVDNPYAFLERVKQASHQVIGVTSATLSHGEAWNFAEVGKLLERADKSSRILDVKYFTLLPDPSHVGRALDVVQWTSLLESTSALHMYRKRYGQISPQAVAEVLIFDRFFPRSMRFCVALAEERLRAISGSPPGVFSNPAEQKLGQLTSLMNYTSVDEVITSGLHEFIDGFQLKLNATSDAVFETFFQLPTPTPDPQAEATPAP